MSKLPLPRDIRPEIKRQPEIPHPIQRPSNSWLMAHKEVIYDSTENWKKSDLLLRLGTIAVNYDLDPTLSSDPVLSDTILTYGVKVAYRDENGNPQVWRRLPFVQPDITPWVKKIIGELSTLISGDYVTKQEFCSTTNALSVAIDTAPIDTDRLNQRSGFDFLNCGTATTVISAEHRPDSNLIE